MQDIIILFIFFQVPLVFVLMSGKSKEDYTAVFNAAKDLLPATTKLKEFMMDFEVAVWSALGECFLGITVKGK